MPHAVTQSSTQGFYLFADSAATYGEGMAGLAISVALSKSGGAFNVVSPTITDRGNGLYWIAPIAAHRDTLGEIAWRFTATGAVIAPRIERVVAVNDQISAWGANTIAPPTTEANAAAVLAAATATGGIEANMIKVNSEPLEPVTDIAKESSIQQAITAINGLEGPGGSPTGPGGIPVTIPVSINNQPVDGVAVWITTDPEGTNQIAGILYTNTFGNTQPPFTLEAGIFYVWVQKAGINFTNPQSIQVFENGTYQWYTG